MATTLARFAQAKSLLLTAALVCSTASGTLTERGSAAAATSAWDAVYVSQFAYTDQALTQLWDIERVSPGQTGYLTFTFRNAGTETWSKVGSPAVKIGTSNPRDRSSEFYTDDWLSNRRAATMNEAAVAPGEIATFVFKVQAPSRPGVWREHFELVAEGVTWFGQGVWREFTVLDAETTVSLTPARLFDSRADHHTIDGQYAGVGRLGPEATVEFVVAGRAGVPNDASAVMVNVTAVQPTGKGYLTVFPCGEKRPLAANVNYQAGRNTPNAALAKIGADGKVCVYTRARTDLVVDVNGFVPSGGSPIPLLPARLLDSRPGHDTIDGRSAGIGRLNQRSITSFTVTGRGGVPVDASAVMLNVTAVGPDGNGFLTVHPCGEDPPLAASANYTANRNVANAVLAGIGTDGKVCVYALAGTDLIIDVSGFVPANGSPTAMLPARLYESRPGYDTVDGQHAGVGRLPANATTEFVVAGRGDVPDDATAAMLNVTAVEPDEPGYLSVYPCGQQRPLAASVNYQASQVVANAALAKIGTDGKVCVYTRSTTDVVIDINGYIGVEIGPECSMAPDVFVEAPAVGSLRVGHSGSRVVALQEHLIWAGHALQSGADGRFGVETRDAVRAVQEDSNSGLIVDCIVGAATRRALNLLSYSGEGDPRDFFEFRDFAGRCATVSETSSAVRMAECDGTLYQMWVPRYFEGTLQIRGFGNRCLSSSVPVDGDPLGVRQCPRDSGDLWRDRSDPPGQIQEFWTDRCLEARDTGTAGGVTSLVLDDCESIPQQRFSEGDTGYYGDPIPG